VYQGGLARHRVEPRDDGVALLQLLEDSAEVAVDDDGRYRLPSERALGAFAPGALVAALPATIGAVVLGEVVAVDTNAVGTRLSVGWAAADAARLAAPVRALVPVRWREFAGRRSARLRRPQVADGGSVTAAAQWSGRGHRRRRAGGRRSGAGCQLAAGRRYPTDGVGKRPWHVGAGYSCRGAGWRRARSERWCRYWRPARCRSGGLVSQRPRLGPGKASR
jgi:hypothetical protein